MNFKHKLFPVQGIWAEHNFLTFFSHPNPVLSKVRTMSKFVSIQPNSSSLKKILLRY